MAKPEASAVASNIEEIDAPTPAPATAPQTTKTYTKLAIHSEMTDRQNSKVLISTLTGTLEGFMFKLS